MYIYIYIYIYVYIMYILSAPSHSLRQSAAKYALYDAGRIGGLCKRVGN